MTPAPRHSPAAVKLAGLQAAVDDLDSALRGRNELEILARLNSAMSALYGIWLLLNVTGKEQVEWAGDDSVKRTIVGLVFARGEAEHQGNHVAMPDEIGAGTLTSGLLGDRWVWGECSADRDAFRSSKALYDEHVRMRAISIPLRQALTWFEANEELNPPPLIGSPLGNLGGPFRAGIPFEFARMEGQFRSRDRSLP